MTSTKYIGMDVHKESISIAVRNAAGKVVMECVIETKASMILQFIDGLRGDYRSPLNSLGVCSAEPPIHSRIDPYSRCAHNESKKNCEECEEKIGHGARGTCCRWQGSCCQASK